MAIADAPDLLARRKAEMERANALIRERTHRKWVAQEMGISYGYLNQLAYGHCAISSSMKVKIAAWLGMPVEAVFPNGAAAV